MREILYIQAGNLSNHAGTHFWNTQQEYFTYDDDEPVIIDHDVSFRQGISPRGEETFCPRLLTFDRKANFGTLARTNALYTEDEDVDEQLWSGEVDEFRQPTIEPSSYQVRFRSGEDLPPEPSAEIGDFSKKQTPTSITSSDIRYWSDYSRVDYHPRTIQALPDVAEWQDADGNWSIGKQTFDRFDTDTALMEEPFRLFVEECDALQGLQISVDSSEFGSFTTSMLSAFRDEYGSKPSVLTFPIMSNIMPGHIDSDDYRGIRNAVNDALCLHSLSELSAMNVPLQHPTLWQKGLWSECLSFDTQIAYETSAILSAHIETVTLPLRLKEDPLPLFQLCNKLNYGGAIAFAELGGVFPMTTTTFSSNEDLYNTMANFTSTNVQEDTPVKPMHRWDVIRTASDDSQKRYAELGLPSSVSSVFTSIAYPIPSSYPSISSFSSSSTSEPRLLLAAHPTPHVTSTDVLSNLGLTARGLPTFFTRHAMFLDECLRRKVDWAVVGVGDTIDVDDVRELKDDIWALADGFGVEGESEERALEEDEEGGEKWEEAFEL